MRPWRSILNRHWIILQCQFACQLSISPFIQGSQVWEAAQLMDNLSFDMIIQVVQEQKINSITTLDKHKMLPIKKHIWICPFIGWSPCMSCILASRLMSWRWNKHFKLDTARDIRHSTYVLWIGREKNNLLIPMLTLRMSTSILKMRNLSTLFLEIWISSFYQVVCFLCGMATIGYKLGCFSFNVCIMRILNDIIQWIPLCSTPHIALSNSSPPW